MVQDIRIEFAKRLRDLRRQRKWTQEKLAERSGLAYRHVQRLESLHNPPPAKIDTLEKLAKAFQISPAKLLQMGRFGGYLSDKNQGLASLAADAPARSKRRYS